MSILQHRLSTEVIDADYIPPEDIAKIDFLEDYEGGPVAPEDTTLGMNYQTWKLDYNDPEFVLTPQTTGSPYTPFSASGAEQVSFCFDQNARATLVYIFAGSAYLYWYDTQASAFVVRQFSGVKSAMLSLDDKRDRQVGANDIILWYTKETDTGVYTLYTREQRDRFDIEYEMKVDVLPYLWKAGMHQGLRGKVILLGRGGTGTGGLPTIPPGPVVPQANLDFELGDAYWNKVGNFNITQNDPYSGLWSAVVNTIPANYASLENSAFTVVIPNQLVFLSFYVKGLIDTNLKVGIRFYNSNKSLIATKTANINVTTNWTLEAHEFIASSDALYARVFVETNATDGIVSIDDFVFDANIYIVELGTKEYFEVELNSTVKFEVEL